MKRIKKSNDKIIVSKIEPIILSLSISFDTFYKRTEKIYLERKYFTDTNSKIQTPRYKQGGKIYLDVLLCDGENFACLKQPCAHGVSPSALGTRLNIKYKPYIEESKQGYQGWSH